MAAGVDAGRTARPPSKVAGVVVDQPVDGGGPTAPLRADINIITDRVGRERSRVRNHAYCSGNAIFEFCRSAFRTRDVELRLGLFPCNDNERLIVTFSPRSRQSDNIKSLKLDRYERTDKLKRYIRYTAESQTLRRDDTFKFVNEVPIGFRS